jgi:ribonuclease Y
MSLFQTLSGVFQPGKSKKKIVGIKSPRSKKKVFKKPQVLDQSSIREAEAKAREIVVEAKDTALKIRQQAEEESGKIRSTLTSKQSELDRKQSEIEREKAVLEEKQRFLNQIEKQVATSKEDVEEHKKRLLSQLERVASMTKDEARKEILGAYEKRLTADVAKMVKEAEDRANEEADKKAKEILVDALKHGAHDYVAEYTVSSVKLADENAKGRIIGRDGRNIRAFERATGVDVDLDDTPGEVRLSSFDPVRREIARQSLLKLLRDGRIQPTRVEEYVAKAKEEVEKIMFEEGKKLCHAIGVYNLPKEIIATLGRFKFRTSYGQNMISHTLEETKIGVSLAEEIGANVDVVRLGCLLHDIGKVVEDEEGSHVEIGVNFLKRHRIPQAVIDCVEQHHEDKPFTSKEAVLVYVSDAISGARPGARYENYEEYVKRLGKLEEIATSYPGVKEAFALQAGREVRVLVDPEKMTDDESVKLSADIKDRVQSEMTYPGTVTVNVIRETRASAVAK